MASSVAPALASAPALAATLAARVPQVPRAGWLGTPLPASAVAVALVALRKNNLSAARQPLALPWSPYTMASGILTAARTAPRHARSACS